MKKEDLLKYRCATRMIDDRSVDDYEDANLIHPNFELKSVCRIITGTNILSLHNNFFTYQHYNILPCDILAYSI